MREQTEEDIIEIEEIVEEEEEEDDEDIENVKKTPLTAGRRTLTIALSSIVVLAIVVFTYLIVSMLMQHPRVYDDGTLFIPGGSGMGMVSFVAAHILCAA